MLCQVSDAVVIIWKSKDDDMLVSVKKDFVNSVMKRSKMNTISCLSVKHMLNKENTFSYKVY